MGDWLNNISLGEHYITNMDAGVVYPTEGMNKQRPPSVSIPTSGDVNESINTPSMVDQVEENISATKAPTLGAPDEKGRFTKTERQRPNSPGSRPSDVAFSDVATGSDLGPGIEISDLPLSTPRERGSMSSTGSIAGSSIREGDSSPTVGLSGSRAVRGTPNIQNEPPVFPNKRFLLDVFPLGLDKTSLEQMDAEISREGVPTGASGCGAGTKNVSEIHDSGIGGIKPPSDACSPPPGLPTGVDPARETKENIPTGAEDVFEPRPSPTEEEEKPNLNPASSFMETGGPEFFTEGLDPTSAPVQGNFKTHSTYNDIPVPYGDPSAALPPETSHTLIAPVLESLNQAGAPKAHIQHVEQVIYSADGVPGIGHVEGTIERLTTVDQTPNMPPRIQSGFVKPAEEASDGQTPSMRSE